MIKYILLAILACVLSEPAVPVFPNVDGITHWTVNNEDGKIHMQVLGTTLVRVCVLCSVCGRERRCVVGWLVVDKSR